MTPEQVVNLFRKQGALLEGHFIFASGRHGNRFLQAARILQHPTHTERLCRELAARFQRLKVDVVIGPATGGILLAYETARKLGCRAAFTEKDGHGGMILKRGFVLKPGTRALVVEDVITTGGSVQKTIDHLSERGAEIVGVGVLIDRSGGEAKFDCRFEALAQLPLESWSPELCELCTKGIPVVDPDDLVHP
ncbi:MAG: orotate phosphoribosyltransferase [Candidatus Hydrogenedentes bacterium]|nr:orotate phosphoribosyltransferase [Candidatus Hydrogenedentota bacterium]